MRVRAGPLSRPGYTNPVQQVDGRDHGRSPAYGLMCSQLLDDLVPHPLHRVQRCHRVLEDHRHSPAPDALELTLRCRYQVEVAEHGTARKTGIRATGKAHERHRGPTDLPDPGFAHEPEQFAPIEGEGDVVYGASTPSSVRKLTCRCSTSRSGSPRTSHPGMRGPTNRQTTLRNGRENNHGEGAEESNYQHRGHVESADGLAGEIADTGEVEDDLDNDG